ncbi:MAG: hypothetical protein KIS61_28960, partial [Candidatus Eremiobacteraeota bacterium]|nr:hypothetical protein [Candidatus Eremiobacteraeota bacterium]
MPTIPSMKGDGFYDQHSQVQEQFILSSQDLIEEAARAIPLPENGPIGLADLGCSEGKNSLMLMRKLTQLVRQRSQQPLMITHNDLPANNWNGFFRNLTPYGPNIWAQANATSFFQPVVPPGTLHIACCYSTVHWLSQLPPVPNPNGVLFALMEPQSRKVLVDQAARDWEAFLQARAEELVPGGRLIIVSGGNQDGDVAGLKMYRLLDQILQELGHPPFVMPIYYRDEQEIRQPLERCGFQVEQCRIQRLTTPFAEQLERDGDRQKYAKDTTGFLRAWMEPLLPDPRIYEILEERLAA